MEERWKGAIAIGIGVICGLLIAEVTRRVAPEFGMYVVVPIGIIFLLGTAVDIHYSGTCTAPRGDGTRHE